MTEYQRMKYGHDQREWVRVANEEIPKLEAELSKLQLESANLYKAIQSGYFQNWSWNLYHDTNRQVHYLMNRLLHLHGMRNANS